MNSPYPFWIGTLYDAPIGTDKVDILVDQLRKLENDLMYGLFGNIHDGKINSCIQRVSVLKFLTNKTKDNFCTTLLL